MHALFFKAGQAAPHLEDEGKVVHALAAGRIRKAAEGACAIVQQHRNELDDGQAHATQRRRQQAVRRLLLACER